MLGMLRYLSGQLVPVVFNLLLLVPLSGYAAAVSSHGPGMVALTDADLSGVTGQALFVSDKIGPDSLPGYNQADTFGNFTYYRMGMDIDLSMNANIAKLQLGCGGVNDALDPTLCDIDLDYVRFMGRSNTVGGAPCTAANCTNAATPATSEFLLRRPYVELAIKNDGTANREVVGFKLGAQVADGYVGVGRRYANGNVNAENGGTCNNGTAGASTLACHSGANSISGFLGAELSAALNVRCSSFLCAVGGASNVRVCVGATARTDDLCNASTNDNLFIDVSGTRMSQLATSALALEVSNAGLLSLLGITTGYSQLTASLRMLHGFTLINTNDFFISFQRERVSWPRYSKTLPPNNGVDACNPAYGTVPGRCNSAYAVASNTGWWMNVPEAKVVEVYAPDYGPLTIGELTTALSQPGLPLVNPELGLTPPKNCYGTARFC